MFKTGAALIDAEHAFTQARRRARVRRLCRVDLPVYATAGAIPPTARGLHEIPLDAISGTLEPNRARQFDAAFRPLRAAGRHRWERIWIAEEHGTPLPPISVVPIHGGGFAVRDGHHRVSVARARGAVAIDALVGD